MKKIIYQAVIFILIFSRYLPAQQQDVWRTFKTSDGLIDNYVLAIVESSDGAMWFGTSNGVSRYKDGNWTTFTTNNGLTNNHVLAIIESLDGALWFATCGGGISRYQFETWTTFDTSDGLAHNDVRTIFESANGALWFGTYGGGVSQYHQGIWTTISTANGLVNDEVFAIYESSDGAMWIGTNGGGVSHYWHGNWTTFSTKDGLAYNGVWTITESSDSAMWFGTYKGVSRYYQRSWTTFDTSNGLAHNYVQKIIESSVGTLWFATFGGGVSRYHQGIWKTFTTDDGLAHNYVQDVFEASDGTVWLGTFGGGVSQYQPGKIAAPVLISPPNHSYSNNNTPILSFTVPTNKNEDPLHFIIEISADVDFANPIFGSPFFSYEKVIGFNPIPPLPAGIGICSYTLQTPLNDGTYYWRVSAYDGIYYGEPSPAYNFKIDTQPPDAPIKILANGGNPSPWQRDDDMFVITWENPTDTQEIARYFYKLQIEPAHNNDTTGTILTTPEFTPRMTIYAKREFGDTLHIWLMDKAGNLDFRKHSSVALLYYKTDPTKKVMLLEPRPGEQVNENIYCSSTIFDFPIDSCVLNYQLGIHAPVQIDVPLEQVKGKNQFNYVWSARHITQESAPITINLHIWDEAGNLYCDKVTIVLNPALDLPTAIIYDPRNEVYLCESHCITGFALGNDFAQYTLSLSTKQQTLKEPILTKSTTPKGIVGAEELFNLNTKQYPEGKYTLNLEVKNNHGLTKSHAILISFDNTPPTAEILAPLAEDTLSCFVEIQGIVSDSNLDYATLTLSKEGDVTTTILDSIRTSGWFTRKLNTINLFGKYHLRLSANDKAGLSRVNTRTFYFLNHRYNMRTALEKTVGEFSLYIPPHGYKPAAICLEKRNKEDFEFTDEVIPTDLIVQIHSDISETDSCFNKQCVLTIYYGYLPEFSFQENGLAVYQRIWENNRWQWKFLGGTTDINKGKIVTTIPKIGIYGLFMIQKEVSDYKRDLELSFQPRIFSPQGGGHDFQTAISFELGKASNVTIKIYNPAGRLVKALKENEPMSHGNNVVYWDGKDQRGEFCVSGLYIVTIQAEEKMATKTIVVLNK